MQQANCKRGGNRARGVNYITFFKCLLDFIEKGKKAKKKEK